MRHLPLRILIAILFLCSFACAAGTSTDTSIAHLDEEIDFHVQIGDYIINAQRIMNSANASSDADCRASQRAMQELLIGVRGLELPSTDRSYYRTLRHTSSQALTLLCESLDPDRATSSRTEAAREAQVLIDECAALIERKTKRIE